MLPTGAGWRHGWRIPGLAEAASAPRPHLTYSGPALAGTDCPTHSTQSADQLETRRPRRHRGSALECRPPGPARARCQLRPARVTVHRGPCSALQLQLIFSLIFLSAAVRPRPRRSVSVPSRYPRPARGLAPRDVLSAHIHLAATSLARLARRDQVPVFHLLANQPPITSGH